MTYCHRSRNDIARISSDDATDDRMLVEAAQADQQWAFVTVRTLLRGFITGSMT
jgi:hypothetical protein